jgi:hypothetical protein
VISTEPPSHWHLATADPFIDVMFGCDPHIGHLPHGVASDSEAMSTLAAWSASTNLRVRIDHRRYPAHSIRSLFARGVFSDVVDLGRMRHDQQHRESTFDIDYLDSLDQGRIDVDRRHFGFAAGIVGERDFDEFSHLNASFFVVVD